MKQYLKMASIVAVAATIFSCSSDEPSTQGEKGSTSALINNVQWSADTSGANISNGKISFFARSKDLSSITFLLSGVEEGQHSIQHITSGSGNIGTFTTAEQDVLQQLFSNIYPSEHEEEIGGVFTVSEINTKEKWISGSFEVKLSHNHPDDSMITITNGIFHKVKYTEGTANNINNSFTAKINGNLFAPETSTGSLTNQKIIINGTLSGAETLGITVSSTIQPGTYSLESGSDQYSGTYIVGEQYYVGQSGQLVITNHDQTAHVISGTFNFSGADIMGTSGTVNVTDGSFAVKY